MKKVLAIIVTGLLLSGEAFAEIYEFKQCLSGGLTITNSDGKTTRMGYNQPGTWEDFTKRSPGILAFTYSVNPSSNLLTYTRKFSQEHVEKINKGYDNLRKDGYTIAPSRYLKTITQESFKIVNFAAGLVTAKKIKEDQFSISSETVLIEIDTGKVTRQYKREGKRDLRSLDESSESIETCEIFPAGDNEKGSGSSGTAFFINSKGYLLTNHHVIDGCKDQKINYNEKEIDAKIIATDKSLDLALLKVDIRPKSYISVTNDEPKKRQKVTAAGYPLGKFLSDDLKINDGRISALKGFEDNSFQIQHDIPINPGNSGGPIVNEDGELVAIAVSGMSKEITEGLNFGIKVSAVKNFLNSNKIKASSSFMSLGMNDDKLVDLLEKSTVYTFCE